MKEDLLKIINTFGINAQQRKLQEEIFELQEAITDYEYEYLDEIKYHIEEELADVMILLNQIKEYYGIDKDKLKETIKYKIGRTLQRIDDGYYE